MRFVVIVYLLIHTVGFGQHNFLFQHTFFRDELLNNSRKEAFHQSTFFPVTENDYNLNQIIRDSSKQYYDFTEMLFKKHLIEVKGEDFFLTISPIVDFYVGKDVIDTNKRRLFQNTRGIMVEGDILKNFSFSTAVYENQGRYSLYETSYFKLLGERYPNQSSGTYGTQNAVIPGAGRTKPFNDDGFDYAYAVGNIIYRAKPYLIFSAGNSSHFIGDGYRSLLLSDNSAPAPFFRVDWKINPKWSFNFLRLRTFNLLRKPVTTAVEAYYEAKATSINYVSYKPNEKWIFSLFDGTIWSKGDSIRSNRVNPLFYSPVPGISGILLDDSSVYNVLGLNVSAMPFKNTRMYGQFAIGDYKIGSYALQLGARYYLSMGLNQMIFQLEFNSAQNDMFVATNNRLSYGHYNLALAHPKGTNFDELLFRYNFSHLRWYAELKSVLYLLKDHYREALLAGNGTIEKNNGTSILEDIEMGYRFNKKMNLTLFVNWQLRYDTSVTINQTTHVFGFGLKTGINNHYRDF
jgi:hypothetical protein